MLKIDTLTRGKRIFNPISEDARKGDGVYDLTLGSISYENVTLRFTQTYLVPDDYQMRPDLIARETLGDGKLVGSLMKANSISNPFAIDSKVLLLIPNEGDVEGTFFKKEQIDKSRLGPSTNQESFRKSQQNKVFEVSSSRKNFLEAQNKSKSPSASPVPPNILQPGQTTTTIENGTIFLGNSSGGGSNTPSTI